MDIESKIEEQILILTKLKANFTKNPNRNYKRITLVKRLDLAKRYTLTLQTF